MTEKANNVEKENVKDIYHFTWMESELCSLHGRLQAFRKGSAEYKHIQDEISDITARIDAHRELFRGLERSLDRERMMKMLESVRIFERRLSMETDQLLTQDLTFTEFMRLEKLRYARAKKLKGEGEIPGSRDPGKPKQGPHKRN